MHEALGYCWTGVKPQFTRRCIECQLQLISVSHDDVIKWKHFSRYWPFLWGIHRSPVNSPKRPVTWSFDVSFELRLNKHLNKNGDAGDFRRYRAHYDVNVIVHQYFLLIQRLPKTMHTVSAYFIVVQIQSEVPISSKVISQSRGNRIIAQYQRLTLLHNQNIITHSKPVSKFYVVYCW